MDKQLIWQKSIFNPPKKEKIFDTLPNSLAKITGLSPNSPAIICEERTYSFQDLASRVAGLADEINEKATHSGPIALIQSISFDAIAAWFACSLAGRAFLLLEPDHPTSRLLELIENAGCSLIIGDHTSSLELINSTKTNFLISDGRNGTLVKDVGLHANDPSMIFPTSGSTGKPKLITYSAVTILAKVQSSILLMQVKDNTKVLIAGSHGNYGFLHHALVFLLAGSAVCLTDVKKGGFPAIFHAINHLGARQVRFTPSMFRKFATIPQAIEILKLLDAIRFSGEPLLKKDLELAYSVLKPECFIQNIYGSTESALFIWSTANDLLPTTESTVPIGRIYPNASFAIVPIEQEDKNVGELFIRSCFHALGDLIEGGINQNRFPLLDDSSNDRIYATGDIVRQLPDGSLIHLGRTGRMVKVRGHRVFLSEIENHLRAIPGVTGAAVVEQINQDDTIIYGFITTDSASISSYDARNWLISQLPDFMVPRRVETINEIPLMPGGKVDYISLLKKITLFNIESNSTTTGNKSFSLLIDIWDSILWPGAHTHDSDFLALGGDSIGLMLLSVEVEKTFEKKIPIEVFRANCTLSNLADILDMGRDHITIVKDEKLQAKLLWKSLHPSKGIALAMPNFGGWAPAYSFRQAGIFLDHDIWVADFLIKQGNMLQSNRWLKAAEEIVEKIKNGIIPTPRVIFGYSFGGGLAWLVAKLLAETSLCPEFVVMVDAPPLHRIESLQKIKLLKDIRENSHQPPPSLHIRREPLDTLGLGGGNSDKWEPNDNIQWVVELPTVDHLEMTRWNMLEMASEAVSAFIEKKQISTVWKPNKQAPEILGVLIHQAINGNPSSFNKVMNQIPKAIDLFYSDQLILLFLLMYLKKENENATILIHHAIKKWPNSRILQFLNQRIKRKSHWLISENIPNFYPLSIITFETSLAKSHNVQNPKPRIIRSIFLAFDVFLSIIFAEWAKKKIKYKRNADA